MNPSETRMVEPPTLARCSTPAEIRRVVKTGTLKSLSVRLPVGCNLRCRYCYGSASGGTTPGEKPLKYEEIEDFVRQGVELGASVVSLVGDGEPLLYREGNRDVLTLIEYANSLGASVVLFSNCIPLDDRLAESLRGMDVAVVAKLNSLRPEVQDRLVGIQGSYHRLVHGIACLKRAGFHRTNPSRLAVHTVICRDNIREIPDMWRHWRDENVIPYVQVCVPPRPADAQRRFFRELYVSPLSVRRLFEQLREIDRREYGFAWEVDRTYPVAALGCSVVLTGCGLGPNGDVLLCAYTEDPVGNIRGGSLRDIILGDRVRQIRTHRYLPNVGPCRYGCRALAFNLTGDRFTPDPFLVEFLACRNSPRRSAAKALEPVG